MPNWRRPTTRRSRPGRKTRRARNRGTMPKLQTQPTGKSVAQFLGKIPDAGMRADAKRVKAIMKKVTGAKAEMWGPAIVGFGRVQYYKDGTEMPELSFS